jgi:hypothetical protein
MADTGWRTPDGGHRMADTGWRTPVARLHYGAGKDGVNGGDATHVRAWECRKRGAVCRVLRANMNGSFKRRVTATFRAC